MKNAIYNMACMDAIVIYFFFEVLLPFFLEMADQRQRDIKLKDFPSPENIEKLALVKLRLALWWFIMTIFFALDVFPFIIIENKTKRNGAHDFHVWDNNNKKSKTNPGDQSWCSKAWLDCRCAEFSLCRNRFPDCVKSDMMGTPSGDKETASGVNGNHPKGKHTNLEKERDQADCWGLPVRYPLDFFPAFGTLYKVGELLQKRLWWKKKGRKGKQEKWVEW